MRRTLLIGVVLIILIQCAACQSYKDRYVTRTHDTVVAEAKKGGYKLITPEEIKRGYLEDPFSFFLVDTRQAWEYQRQHIRGASSLPVDPYWWYPFSPKNRKDMRNVLGQDRNRQIVFY
jgi:Rhodanese-like domain